VPRAIRNAAAEQGSAADVYRAQIEDWLTRDVPVRRMLELVREGDPPYTASRSAFYARVLQIRDEVRRRQVDAVVRFEGLPGEFLQVPWGEVRHAIRGPSSLNGTTYVPGEARGRLAQSGRCSAARDSGTAAAWTTGRASGQRLRDAGHRSYAVPEP
jgi:hypothetical protein